MDLHTWLTRNNTTNKGQLFLVLLMALPTLTFYEFASISCVPWETETPFKNQKDVLGLFVSLILSSLL